MKTTLKKWALACAAVALGAMQSAVANQFYSGYFTDKSGIYSCDTATCPATMNTDEVVNHIILLQ